MCEIQKGNLVQKAQVVMYDYGNEQNYKTVYKQCEKHYSNWPLRYQKHYNNWPLLYDEQHAVNQRSLSHFHKLTNFCSRCLQKLCFFANRLFIMTQIIKLDFVKGNTNLYSLHYDKSTLSSELQAGCANLYSL